MINESYNITNMIQQPPVPASFFRRLSAISYDLLILLALLMVGTWILMPFTGGEAIDAENRIYQLYLLGIGCGYYLFLWRYGGQTVGMRAWRLRLQTSTGLPLTWQIASKRLGWAIITLLPFGLGLWVALFHPYKQTLYDILAGTKVYKSH